jgi:predicted hydrocarbon binding protein
MNQRTLSPASLSAVPHASLRALRAALVRDLGDGFATVLQEAGYAGGESVFGAFRDWCTANGQASPEAMNYQHFKEMAARFFAEAGWGNVTMSTVGDAVVAIDSDDWSEADPTAGMPYPSCYYTAGMLADFFGRVADGQLGCMEVECRTAGSPNCRFLLGSPEVVGHVYQKMADGLGYEDALKDIR